jgi:S-adenosylmethionine hydrolase
MITLLTDFGLSDYFVPAVKGVILSIHPEAQIVDITHEAAAHDVRSAAFTLGACYHDFPDGTIHVAVVDPGVGSSRRAIVVDAGRYIFVGPDNGLFSFVYARESAVRVFHITEERFFRHPVSPTFHGRDIFAPVAAHLLRGTTPGQVGVEIADYVRFEIPRPRLIESEGTKKLLQGAILHIDRFGNCITTFTNSDLSLDQINPRTRFYFGGREIRQFGAYFAEVASQEDLLALLGSAGFWEIALWRQSAAKLINARCGDEVILDCGL